MIWLCRGRKDGIEEALRDDVGLRLEVVIVRSFAGTARPIIRGCHRMKDCEIEAHSCNRVTQIVKVREVARSVLGLFFGA